MSLFYVCIYYLWALGGVKDQSNAEMIIEETLCA